MNSTCLRMVVHMVSLSNEKTCMLLFLCYLVGWPWFPWDTRATGQARNHWACGSSRIAGESWKGWKEGGTVYLT